MKNLILKILFFTLVIFAPVSAMAQVSVHINIPLPPPIFFPAPPDVVVIPETHVYAVPDIQEDIFFYSGWWWRPWQGRWYRSRYYDRGWAYYHRPPSFHRNVPQHWRSYYRDNRWKGNAWRQQRIPHRDMQRNWQSWKHNRHWEQNRWGVQPPQKRSPKRDARHQRGPQSRPAPGPDYRR